MNGEVARPKPRLLPLLLGIWFALSGAALLVLSLVVILSALLGRLSAQALVLTLTASALLLLSCYHALRQAFGKTSPPLRVAGWMPDLALFALWIATVLAGWLAQERLPSGWQYPLAMIAFGLPPLLLLRIGLRIQFPLPGWQGWSAFGLGLSLVPLLLIILEFAAMAGIILIALVLHPQLMNTLTQLAAQLEATLTPDEGLSLLISYLNQPRVLLGVFALLSVIAPLLEEALKPLGLWLLAGEIEHPAHGFALGILSGAAFTLLEGLGNIPAAGADWALTAMGRLGTSLMHMLTSGLLGWALVSAWQKRRFGQLALAYALVVLMHGFWNGLNIVNILGQITEKPRPWMQASLPALIGLAILLLPAYLLAARAAARSSQSQV